MRKKGIRMLTKLILIWAAEIYVLLPDMAPDYVDDVIIVESIISVVVLLED